MKVQVWRPDSVQLGVLEQMQHWRLEQVQLERLMSVQQWRLELEAAGMWELP